MRSTHYSEKKFQNEKYFSSSRNLISRERFFGPRGGGGGEVLLGVKRRREREMVLVVVFEGQAPFTIREREKIFSQGGREASSLHEKVTPFQKRKKKPSFFPL